MSRAPGPRGLGPGHWVTAIALASWLWLTLQPGGDRPPHFGWGEWDLADGLRNLALTAPFGAGLAMTRRSVARAAGVATALAVAIELAQWWVPGRDASPVDVLANGLGAGLGAAAWNGVRAARGLSDAAAGLRALVSGLAVVALVGVTAAAFAPSFPPSVYDPAWTPDLPWLSRPRSEVLSARIGPVPVPGAAPAESSEALREALRRGLPARIRWVFQEEADDPPAPLVRLNDAQSELWMVAVAGRDLVWQWRVRAGPWGLEEPAWRWRGALAEARPGDVLSLVFRIDGAGLEARLDGDAGSRVGSEAFRTHLSTGSGWRLLWPTRHDPDRGVPRPWWDASWLALAWIPLGLHARLRLATGAAIALGAAALGAAPWVGLAAPTAATAGAACAGLAVGAGLGHPRMSRGRPGPSGSWDQKSV